MEKNFANNTNIIAGIALVIGLFLLGFNIPSITGMETVTVNVTESLTTTMVVSTVAFGNMAVNATDNTTDDSPVPFKVENTGNVNLNISVNAAASLWTNQNLNTAYFQFKCGNATGEWSRCTSSFSQPTFTNMIASATKVVGNLSWGASEDLAEIEINVTVPDAEPAGSKSSTLTFTASACNCP